ncbi:TPA: pro-sigmaK processing inhibitor BofA family protein [Candidatus Avacholeplasma faecigallinarum]|nr:pro-sigmaK processing inhibitor BofA family protein [Candidatus Avacholeplasma faecigallinarum]
MKTVKYIIKSLIFGVLFLLIINLIGQFFNFRLPFSILSILLLGFLRIPGLIILLIFLIL